MRVAIAQINPILGDFEANRKKILDNSLRALEKKCDLVVFPEAALLGYHPFDLLERPEFFEQQDKAFKDLTKTLPKGIGLIFGLLTKNPKKLGRSFYNSAVLVEKGKKPQYFHKELLPTGDVFDEARFIEEGRLADNFFKFKGRSFFLSICEDIWGWPDSKGNSQYKFNPLAKVPKKKIDLVVNLSASPFYPGKQETRKELVRKTSQHFRAPMIYCNLVGAQDEIIFDGRSFLVDKKGQEVLRAQAFAEDLLVFDLDQIPKPIKVAPTAYEEDIRQGIVLGLRDYCQKTGLNRIHLGVSGGIDSALALCLAVDALGSGKVNAYYLPTEFNASESQKAARELCENIQVEFQEISIQHAFQSFRDTIDQALGLKDFGLVHENLQARIRGAILMAISNKDNSLLVACANKSELAAGYSTLYGDICGGILPIGDLTKGEVYRLAHHYNKERQLIPEFILDRAPSAELRPNQKDQDTLPPYEELDASVKNIVQDNKPIRTDTDQWLIQALFKSEFKRWQAAPILKVSKHSFGRGRRWPVAHKLGKYLKK